MSSIQSAAHRVYCRAFAEVHNLVIGLAPFLVDKQYQTAILLLIVFLCLIALQNLFYGAREPSAVSLAAGAAATA